MMGLHRMMRVTNNSVEYTSVTLVSLYLIDQHHTSVVPWERRQPTTVYSADSLVGSDRTIQMPACAAERGPAFMVRADHVHELLVYSTLIKREFKCSRGPAISPIHARMARCTAGAGLDLVCQEFVMSTNYSSRHVIEVVRGSGTSRVHMTLCSTHGRHQLLNCSRFDYKHASAARARQHMHDKPAAHTRMPHTVSLASGPAAPIGRDHDRASVFQ